MRLCESSWALRPSSPQSVRVASFRAWTFSCGASCYTVRVDQLLPREERIHWILDKSARLLQGGAEPVSGIILPTAERFPDKFDKSPGSVRTLLKRVARHAGLNHVGIEGNLVVPDEGGGGGGCASGACGIPSTPQKIQRVEKIKKGYRVNIIANELGNPVILLTAMVRAVSHVFLQEADLAHHFSRKDYEPGIDLTGVLLGFGTLLCNGAYVYRKG